MVQSIKTRTIANIQDIPGLVRKLCIAWLSAVVLEYLLLPASLRNLAVLTGLAQMSLPRVALITGIMTIMLLFVPHQDTTIKIERWCLVGVFGILATATLIASYNVQYLIACVLVFAILVVYAIKGWDQSSGPLIEAKKAPKVFVWITALLAAGFFAFVCVWTVGRIYCFSTPSYDFGIFAQMFHNMKEIGLPMTTLERSKWLSHFDVHVSPIYYLMLPFYWIFPKPVTLQVLQAAILASAVIPLWNIAKHHGFSGIQRTLICGLLLLLPAYSGGTSYDLHENCFLTPLLLWLFYGIDRKNTAITAIAAILTLMVKEDAAVYVAVIALWLIVQSLLHIKKLDKFKLITGTVMLGASIGWFLAVTGYLASIGDGVMTYRYDNFIYDGSSSLTAVIFAIILNPMKAVFECAGADKVDFILQTMLPLLCLPLLTRRYERYLLLIPYILINLMSDYVYQHSVFFQYNFGSIAFVLYLVIVNLADLRRIQLQNSALWVAVAIATAFSVDLLLPAAKIHPLTAVRNYGYFENVRNTLSTIPENASVAATTFYTTHLSQRPILYDIMYCSKEDLLACEYVALDTRLDSAYVRYAMPGMNDGFENLTELLEKNGYQVYTSYEDYLVIYHKK